ncbi:MAG: efflux RND transporter periplasmic adaptor subunit [Polyangiaceae bacterium]|nr:efflux RND transporter periplasmic adaptor subunit [Polyangiaceae bacterium]MCK6535894.1 efflux RND transporter periplasmic adaptor subunit [Polyangiaceae bacterium]
MAGSRRRPQARWLALGGVIVLGASAIAWTRFRAVPVVVSPVVRGQAVEAVYATGSVEAADRVVVKAKTSGSIAELFAREGSKVKKGDLLARIDNPTASFDLERGRSDSNAASAQAGKEAPQLAALAAQGRAVEAELKQAKLELERSRKLVERGSAPASESERAQARVDQLQGTLDANRAQQRALRIDLSANAKRQASQVKSLTARVADTEVRAPLDGVVLGKSVELGEVVSVNQPLFRVADTRVLVLEVNVDEADIARVSDGQTGKPKSEAAISLYAFAKTVFRGEVTEVLPDADRQRRAFVAKISFSAPPPELRSGMTAEVNIVTARHDAVLLAPSSAESEGSVWVLANGRVERRAIQVGIRDLLRLEVVSGLAEGESVVIEGRDKLAPGSRVSATVRPADKREPLPDAADVSQTTLR